MYKDADIIDELERELGQDVAQSSVERLLRVPQAWEALREPEFLRAALEASGGQALFPSLLAAVALGVSTLSEALSSEHSAEPKYSELALQQTSKQALELCRIERESGTQELIDFTRNSSEEWRSAFICAWSEFEDHRTMLEVIASGQHPSLADLIASTLLAYMPTQQAVAELLALEPGLSFHLLPWVQNEPELFEALRSELIELSDLFQFDPDAHTIGASRDALILGLLGRSADAHQAIHSAWEDATQMTASVADSLADIARVEDDLVLEVEARQQALDAYPSPTRRSMSAVSLLQVERYEDALNLVREGESFEENIAAGLIFLAIQDTHSAGKRLNEAAQQCTDAQSAAPHWFVRLAEGLQSIGFSVQAIRVYEQLIARYPARQDLHTPVAKLLAEIGDHNSAIQHAKIAVALNPTDVSTRELLANTFEQSGEPEAALPHWQIIAEIDAAKNVRLGQCALAAGNPELAEQAAERVLDVDPDDVNGLVLAGRAFSAAGKHTEAKQILKDVTDRAPDDAQAWIALAASLEATGEAELAGAALQNALRSLPDDAELHIARAAWLKSYDRLAEALEHTGVAVKAMPGRMDWQMQHAELLNQLGRFEAARTVLEKVVAAEPANWKAVEQLARIHEHLDDIPSALSLVESAPAFITPESAFYVGRLMAKSGSSAEHCQQAVERLSEAKSSGLDDAAIDYWLGVAEHKNREYQPAAKHFLRYLEAVKDSSAEHYLDAAVTFAKSALEIGETTLALTQLNNAKPSFPTSIELLVTLSEAHDRAGNRDKSLSIAREALELYPESVKALNTFKCAAERSGQLEEAIEAQRKLTAQAPDEPDNWLDMARIDRQRGEEPAARAALARAITLGKQDAQVLSKAADHARSIAVPTLGIRLLKRAASIDAQNDEYHQKLASAAAEAGDLETAADAWVECARRRPQDHAMLLPAAEALWKLNRRTAAIGLLQQAVSVAPEEAKAHFELGRGLLLMNDVERGLNEISKAISVDPEDSVLRAQVALLMARYGEPEDGLTILDGAPSAGKFPEVAEARAECHWLNGDVQATQNALKVIPAAVPLSARGLALQSMIKLAAGDLDGAARDFEQIQGKQISSPAELEWVMKTGLALGDISRSLELVQVYEHNGLIEPEALLTELQARISIQNLAWLNQNLAHSTTWSTPPGFGDSNPARVDELIASSDDCKAPEASVKFVRQLIEVIRGAARPDAIEFSDHVVGFGSGFIKQCKAIALLRANRPSKVINVLEILPRELHDRSIAALLQGLAYSSAGQTEPAKASFKLATEFAALKPLAMYLEAGMWEKAGEYQYAITCMNEAISLQPTEAAWHYELASYYEAIEQPEAALPHLQQAAEFAPEDSQILLALARAYRGNGQLSDAEEMYARSLHTNPGSPKVWKEAGQVALARGENERAEAWFERACTLLPSDASCVIGSARSAQQLGKTREALDRARKAFDMSPDDPVVLSGLGDILAANGSLDKAIQIYDRALRISENSVDIRLARSKLLLAAKRPQESITDLEQLVELDPDHHEAWETLAHAYTESDEFESAMYAAQQAVNIAPRDVEYRLLMAKLCRQAGQLDQALEILTEVEQEAPERVDVAREKGIVHEDRRELDLAISAYNRALAIDSHDAQTVVKAGLLLKQLKAYEESAALLKRGTELRPDDADLHQQLAAVRALQFVHGHRIDEQVVAT